MTTKPRKRYRPTVRYVRKLVRLYMLTVMELRKLKGLPPTEPRRTVDRFVLV
jgi:hypothetical protein